MSSWTPPEKPGIYTHPKQRKYYRDVLSGKIDIRLKVEIDLVDGTKITGLASEKFVLTLISRVKKGWMTLKYRW